MTPAWPELLDWLDAQLFGGAEFVNVMTRMPDFTVEDAYRARAELVRRRCARGDTLAGYKVAGSSVVVRKDEHVEGPLVGCILRSCVRPEGEPIAIGARKMAIEAEIGVVLRRDLQGPGVTLVNAIAATEAVFPAFEILSFRGGPRPSHQARIVASNFSGAYMFGGPMTSLHGIDLRTEGMSLSVDGEARGSGTGIEVLGNPLHAIALVANTIAASGEALKAGMVVMTGSIIANVPVAPGNRVLAEFTRLGKIAVRFQ